MRLHSPDQLPEAPSLLRQWKRWESGEVMPGEFYQPVIAATFGTVTHAMFPVAPKRDAEADVLAMSGMDTLELVSRLSDPAWIRRRWTGCGSWPAGCAPSTRTCPVTSC
jgi:hypothetical protein